LISRQAYLQQLLKQALATMGFQKEADASTHFSYEMVALSLSTARELGYDADPEGKPFVEVSGRKGLGVRPMNLLDSAHRKQRNAKFRSRNAEQDPAASRRTAEMIAVAALALLPDQVREQQGHRVRHRRGPEF
jgi:arginyl-tRNA synthetase